MAAYALPIREEPVRDEAGMAACQRMSRDNPHSPRPTPLVLSGATTRLEDPLPGGAPILQFPRSPMPGSRAPIVEGV